MSRVPAGRYVPELDGDFVVFLLGMRVRRPWRLRSWVSVYRAMPRMLEALDADPESGLLGWERALIRGPAVVQYWRSFEHLERFARDSNGPHVAAWREWNRSVRASGAVGIWHETYQVRAGEYEGIYSGMPRFGLAAAGRHVPIGSAGLSAGRRIGVRDHDVPTPA
jgi:hypothetical protein